MTAVLVETPLVKPLRSNGIGALISGLTTMAVGGAGASLGLAAVFGTVPRLSIPWLLPLSGVQLEICRLGGLFMALTGAVAIPVGVFSVAYARRERWGPLPLSVLPAFVAAMELVPAAGSVATFLCAWEFMAITSLVLLATTHRRPEVRSAAGYYAVMTQLSFAAILLGLMLAVGAAGSGRFADLGATPDRLRGAVFALTLVGFGCKAGLVPLHAWLPRAHPEAPSQVSALMSAAMVNLGVYGIVRVDLQLLGPGPRWWGIVLLAVGAVSAVYGVLEASVSSDLKRLLGYSTIENMGLVTIGLGASTLFAAAGARAAAMVAMTAALLHLIAHAAFKSLGFMAAGSVLVATGQRDLDKLGGLARRMPWTTVLFGIAALGASGLPLGAGFVGEWLLVQSLVHGGTGRGTLLGLVTPLGVGAVALTTGLGVAAMVKAFGTGFLSAARSANASQAQEVSVSMCVGMAMAATSCVVVALVPSVVASPLQAVLRTLPATTDADLSGFGTILRLPGIDGAIAPGLIAAALILALLVVRALAGWGTRWRPADLDAPLWACGADELTPRMQYTASSFAEPLQRVFDDLLRPDSDVEVTHLQESRYHVEKIAYRLRLGDAVEERFYAPVLRAVACGAHAVRRVHTGSVHLYLAYGSLGVLIVLVFAR